mmetsp:Transcript_11922/g.28941  ORF Transcript_11922/g.28941 Transcript_11922/m.28941 type:complete len:206 (-) Transcript_11922:16-633(-)
MARQSLSSTEMLLPILNCRDPSNFRVSSGIGGRLRSLSVATTTTHLIWWTLRASRLSSTLCRTCAHAFASLWEITRWPSCASRIDSVQTITLAPLQDTATSTSTSTCTLGPPLPRAHTRMCVRCSLCCGASLTSRRWRGTSGTFGIETSGHSEQRVGSNGVCSPCAQQGRDSRSFLRNEEETPRRQGSCSRPTQWRFFAAAGRGA